MILEHEWVILDHQKSDFKTLQFYILLYFKHISCDGINIELLALKILK